LLLKITKTPIQAVFPETHAQDSDILIILYTLVNTDRYLCSMAMCPPDSTEKMTAMFMIRYKEQGPPDHQMLYQGLLLVFRSWHARN